ncbi:MAG: peptidoglycan DD-metalloendopeptidase family protein [Anaerolineales bacterium]|nr:peptidoglycan DD-metalloendopeptidase family protein [Anaerolineales bacterium]
MLWKLMRGFLLLIVLLFPLWAVQAQSDTDTATYLVQAGDSLWSIAQRFRVSVTELAAVNNLQNPNQLVVGMELTIPAIEGYRGRLTSLPLTYGESIQWISRKYQISVEQIIRFNHIISPNELYAGAPLVLPEEQIATVPLPCFSMPEEMTPLEVSILMQTNPWQIAAQNQLTQTIQLLPGEPYLGLAETHGETIKNLVCPFAEIKLSPTRFLQGKTAVVRLQGKAAMNLQVSFMGRDIPLIEEAPETYVVLLGVHAMADPGLYPLEIYLLSGGTVQYALSQMVNVGKVDYPYDNPLTVDPETIDPAVTEPENELWASYAQTFTPQKYWQGEFVFPSPLSKDYCLSSGDCWSSRFGNRRSYNGGTYDYFHTGLDIVGKEGVEIYAPADGVVVFAGPLTVRGNATMIDHGWGVYTGYYHQKEVYVQVGDRVQAGQVIGLVGATGRSQGPHLHFEVWVNGVQVDPLDWLTQAFP